ncbi:hypothetical protein TRFO_34565 [Tritrichomonas foetus]|uniref:Uncharacterized protein n=1 Tax=Tritrichomonas foetus TaxID=1144522 RepID=A0A1J4JL23_9EUKA|nr:hypothetical protein TRFO_34565 [Tritrichomonas foetus]|eukprot:OHS99111.1 hypothetical protein TRFO_34565 [Tritrichomonas foetus]
MASRAPTMATTASSALSRLQTDIKPSDVHELKLKTQQILLKTRHLRTQLNRLNDRITSETNAINKTFEQQTDQAPVASNHKNSVSQLSRSVECAENTLANLKDEIENVRQNDKTFLVNELREEVKLAYCENQRLTKELQDRSLQANTAERLLQDAARKASSQNINELKASIREMQAANADLREKAIAYRSKRAKLLMEQTIAGHQEKKVSTQTIVDEANNRQEETTKEINKNAEELQDSKKEYEEKIGELQAILEEQRQKITDFLSGKMPEPKDEGEKEGDKEEDSEEKKDEENPEQ